MIYLPDTNTISAYMRGGPHGLVARMQGAFARFEALLGRARGT
jgi:hypothetical protein